MGPRSEGSHTSLKMPQTSKIVVCSTIFPYPVDCGKKVVMSGFLEHFVSRCGEEAVEYVIIGARPEDCPTSQDLRVRHIPGPSLARKLVSLVWYSLLLRRKSFQESLLYSPKLRKTIEGIVESHNPDLVLADTVRVGQFFTKVNHRNKVQYLEDLFSLRYRLLALTSLATSGSQMNVLGRFKKFVPSSLHRILNFAPVLRFVLLTESRLIEKSENRLLKCFRNNLLVNNDEVYALKIRSREQNVSHVVPMVRLPKHGDFARSFTGIPQFAFVGALDYAPNSTGLSTFIRKTIPHIRKALPEFKLRIVGKGAGRELKALADEFTNVVCLDGFVPDLANLYSEVAALIVPVEFGTGVKLKILEALAYGVPVISTTVGVGGIPVVHGIHCMIADSPQEFSAAICRLCDIAVNREMSRASRTFFDTNYSRRRVFELYDRLFGLQLETEQTASLSCASAN